MYHQGNQRFHYPDEILQNFNFFLIIINLRNLLFVNCMGNITNIHHLWLASLPLMMCICNIPLVIYKYVILYYITRAFIIWKK